MGLAAILAYARLQQSVMQQQAEGHSVSLYIATGSVNSAKLTRLALALQRYDLKVEYIAGANNHVYIRLPFKASIDKRDGFKSLFY